MLLPSAHTGPRGGDHPTFFFRTGVALSNSQSSVEKTRALWYKLDKCREGNPGIGYGWVLTPDLQLVSLKGLRAQRGGPNHDRT
jgi:hypothetical protein